MILIPYKIDAHPSPMITPKLSEPPPNLTMKREPRPPIYNGLRTPPSGTADDLMMAKRARLFRAGLRPEWLSPAGGGLDLASIQDNSGVIQPRLGHEHVTVTGPGGGSGRIHRVRRTSSRSSGLPELTWNPPRRRPAWAAPAPQPSLVVLGCLAPAGEPDMETQRRMPGQIRHDGRRSAG